MRFFTEIIQLCVSKRHIWKAAIKSVTPLPNVIKHLENTKISSGSDPV